MLIAGKAGVIQPDITIEIWDCHHDSQNQGRIAERDVLVAQFNKDLSSRTKRVPVDEYSKIAVWPTFYNQKKLIQGCKWNLGQKKWTGTMIQEQWRICGGISHQYAQDNRNLARDFLRIQQACSCQNCGSLPEAKRPAL